MVETVVALFIVSIVAVLVLSSVQMVSSYVKVKSDSFNQFIQAISYLENELSRGQIVSVYSNSVVFKVDNQMYTIEFYKDMLRKRSDAGGHEPILVNILDGQFIDKNDVQLVVKMSDGKIYEKIFDTIKK